VATAPKFVLAEELDTLEYDFRTPARPDAPHGVIPEPTTKQLDTFSSTLRHIMAPMAALVADRSEPEAELSAADVAAAMATVDEDEAKSRALLDELVVAVAAVCSNTPSVADIEDLPYRGQKAFIGWIMGTFLDPESNALASK
jgi:hypothetical protein